MSGIKASCTLRTPSKLNGQVKRTVAGRGDATPANVQRLSAALLGHDSAVRVDSTEQLHGLLFGCAGSDDLQRQESKAQLSVTARTTEARRTPAGLRCPYLPEG